MKNIILSNHTVEKISLVKEALENHGATGVQFCGINYTEFISGVSPSFQKRAEHEHLQNRLPGSRQEIRNADLDSVDVLRRMTDGIRCHPDYGPNSALYVQCGYIAQNDRASGLVRPGTSGEVAPAPAPTGQAPGAAATGIVPGV